VSNPLIDSLANLSFPGCYEPCNPCTDILPTTIDSVCPSPLSGKASPDRLKLIIASTGIDVSENAIGGQTWKRWIEIACDLFPLSISQVGSDAILYAAAHLIALSLAQPAWNYSIIGKATKGEMLRWGDLRSSASDVEFWGLTPHGIIARQILVSHIDRRRRPAMFAV
jgi:hypothetical protein